MSHQRHSLPAAPACPVFSALDDLLAHVIHFGVRLVPWQGGLLSIEWPVGASPAHIVCEYQQDGENGQASADKTDDGVGYTYLGLPDLVMIAADALARLLVLAETQDRWREQRFGRLGTNQAGGQHPPPSSGGMGAMYWIPPKVVEVTRPVPESPQLEPVASRTIRATHTEPRLGEYVLSIEPPELSGPATERRVDSGHHGAPDPPAEPSHTPDAPEADDPHQEDGDATGQSAVEEPQGDDRKANPSPRQKGAKRRRKNKNRKRKKPKSKKSRKNKRH